MGFNSGFKGLTLTNSPFCLECIYVFLWIWQQTAIIFLYSINWLVCITETECVYCATRTGSLNKIQVNSSSFGRGIVQAFRHRGPGLVPGQSVWNYGAQSGTGTGFYRSIIPPVIYTHVQLFVAPTRKTVGRSLETTQKEMLFRKYGSIRKVRSVFSSLNCYCSHPFKTFIRLPRCSIWTCLCWRSLGADSRHRRDRSVMPVTSTASALCCALKGLRTIDTVSKLSFRNKQKF